MKYLFVILFLFLSCKNIFSQPVLQWSKCYGGLSGEEANSIIFTNDSGFLCVGYTYSCTGDVFGTHCLFDSVSMQWMTFEDVWVIKTDYYGNLQWSKTLGGWSPDYGLEAIETNGGYVIGCTSTSNDGDLTGNNGPTDFWIVKIDFSGNIIWQHNYGGFDEDNLFSLDNSNDGGFVVTGSVSSFNTGDVQNRLGVDPNIDTWLLKLDSLGILQWQRCIGGSGQEYYEHVRVDEVGNIYLISTSGSSDSDVTCNIIGHNAWLVKLDSSGNILWNKCFGGTSGQIINSIKIIGSKLLMSGQTASYNGDLTHNYGDWDAWILLIDTAGNKIFSQSYGGSKIDVINGATMMGNNRIVACGFTLSHNHDISINNDPAYKECWLICTDTLGNLLWERTFGNSYYDEGNSIVNLPDGSFAFAGYTSGPDNNVISGYHGNSQSSQFWLVKFDSLTLNTEKINVSDFQIYPQPFFDGFHVKIPTRQNKNNISSVSLHDIQGKQIKMSYQLSENEINVSTFPETTPGIYILKFYLNNKMNNLKVVKLKQ